MENAFLNLFFEKVEDSSMLLNNFIARQPILNADNLVVAYELMYRDQHTPSRQIDGTASLFNDSVLLFGMLEFANNRLAFINIPERFLVAETPLLLPPEKVVIEITDSHFVNDVMMNIEDIRSKHFQFSLEIKSNEKKQILLKNPEYVKIPYDPNLARLSEKIRYLKSILPNSKIIVRNIETYIERNTLAGLDIDLFQGFFFSKPEIIKTKPFTLSGNSISDLLKIDLEKDFDFAKIATIVKRDAAMTTRFLRLANSAGRKKISIQSVDHALIYLGQYEVKKVITLFILTESANKKPEELCKQALIRAKFCEAVIKIQHPDQSFQAYLVGLLSVLDAIFDYPLDKILPYLGLHEDCNRAILHHEGLLGLILETVMHINTGRFTTQKRLADTLNMTESEIYAIYLEALLSTDYVFNQY